MRMYDFEVLNGDEVISAERSVPLDRPEAACPKIVKLARRLYPKRCRIRVREKGETVILIGAMSALHLSDFDYSSAV